MEFILVSRKRSKVDKVVHFIYKIVERYPQFKKFITPHLIRFGIVGASGAVIGLGVLWLLTEKVGLFYLISYIVSTLIAVTNNWFWNSQWTFKQSVGFFGWLKYLGVSSSTILLNVSLVFVLTSIAGVWYMFSAVIGIGTAFLLNFILSRKVVWKGANASK